METTLLLVSLFAFPGAEPSGPAPGLYSRTTIDLGIVVSDLKKSLKFYRDGLGMTPAGSFDVPGDVAKGAGLTDGAGLHVEVLVLGGGESATRLKLLEFPKAKKADDAYIGSGLGVRYLTLVVADLDPVLERMRAASIPIVPGGPATLGSVAIALVRDPDGNFVEFVGPAKAAPAGAGERSLFDGNSLSGWRAAKNGVWKVAGGAIVGEQGENFGGGWLLTEKEYGDFDLRFEFRLSKGANSGIALRFPPGDDSASPAKTGYECQLSEADPNYRTGSIFGISKAPDGMYREGTWSEGRIRAKGASITVWIDGKQAVSLEDRRSARGLIGLQVHGSEKYRGTRAEFRDITIREE